MDVEVEALSAKEFVLRESVPGQLFRDVSRFHERFGLKATSDRKHQLPNDALEFRYRFMEEELAEYLSVSGMNGREFDAEKAFDALIDLVYVALGTAYLHRFPFDEGWARVQEANMRKVRSVGADDGRSHRGHALDVVKPEGWEPPVLGDLL